MEQTKRYLFGAIPVSDTAGSAWLTAPRRLLDALRRVLGQSDYQARAGSYSGGANAVYWLEVVAKRPDGIVVIRNINQGVKIEAQEVTMPVEPDLVFPLLRGKDVQRWNATPVFSILVVQDRQDQRSGIPEKTMQAKYPKSYLYLKQFESFLTHRPDRKYYPPGSPFYTMRNVARYTFASWKVVWREQASSFTCAVTGPLDGRPVIPDHKLMLVECHTAEEAHYLCALLSASPAKFAIWCYTISIEQTTHILENIRAPRYDPANAVHVRLSALSQRAHALAPAAYGGDQEAAAQLKQVEAEVDQSAAQLWGLSAEELGEIQKSLAELS
jgi:hypothetical protein